MNEDERAKKFLRKLYEGRPRNFVSKVDEKSRGIYAILLYLSHAEGDVCAGDVSREFHISTARASVALKALSQKGLVSSVPSEQDARKRVVTITDAGRAHVAKGEAELLSWIKYLMKEIGEADLDEFLRILAVINRLVEQERD